MFAKTMWLVDMGEVLGLYHVIIWIHELQLANVDFEFDSKKVANYFYKGSNDFMKFGTVMAGCKYYCILFLENSHVGFSRSKTNEVVRVLTKIVMSLYNSHIY